MEHCALLIRTFLYNDKWMERSLVSVQPVIGKKQIYDHFHDIRNCFLLQTHYQLITTNSVSFYNQYIKT